MAQDYVAIEGDSITLIQFYITRFFVVAFSVAQGEEAGESHLKRALSCDRNQRRRSSLFPDNQRVRKVVSGKDSVVQYREGRGVGLTCGSKRVGE